jgi:hypothetical protein
LTAGRGEQRDHPMASPSAADGKPESLPYNLKTLSWDRCAHIPPSKTNA